MFKTFVACLIVFVLPLFSIEKITTETFFSKITAEERNVLERFFRHLVTDSVIRYSLFGDKPMAIEGHEKLSVIRVVEGDEYENVFIKGVELWKNLQVTVDDKDYFFLIVEPEDLDHRHLICVNKRAFLKVVEDYLVLFQYVIGPTITPNDLLKKLIEAGNNFYAILKHDNVLLGILLGYGGNNALYESRKEEISFAMSRDQKEDFPFLSKKNQFECRAFSDNAKIKPAVGFYSLREEYDAIQKQLTISKKIVSQDIPYFACVADSNETKSMIAKYQDNQQYIDALVQNDKALEEGLIRLFTRHDGDIEAPEAKRDLRFDKRENSGHFVSLIIDEIRSEEYYEESFYKAFLEGFHSTRKEKMGSSIDMFYLLRKEIKKAENLEKADRFMKRISQKKKINKIIDGKVYSKTIKKGKGDQLTLKVKNISLHLAFSDFGSSSVEKERIEYLVPGVAHALIGMKRGEVRKVYIHPEYGYGEDAFCEPNLILKGEISLVDFEEGEMEAKITSFYNIKKKDLISIKKDYIKRKKRTLFDLGIATRQFVMSCADFFDLPFICDAFSNKTKVKEFEEKRSFIEKMLLATL